MKGWSPDPRLLAALARAYDYAVLSATMLKNSGGS
jgi:hypothetical protein